MKEKYCKNRIQILNPRTKRYVKMDTEKGGIISHKKSKGPYKNVKIVHYKGEKEEEEDDQVVYEWIFPS